ncbi:hypothetical protein GCM10027598_40030 [Amycolatopsis oliviviridis]|uniref:Uncharacterized protein n=1 Tax=Amycolatopsis oliviviridis TaxID=1471590 RepID=A0ABQ3LCL9_9PSEU|nr:hypothetical protein GCM10017790_21810 [Amycolatopsis oliviviridis]
MDEKGTLIRRIGTRDAVFIGLAPAAGAAGARLPAGLTVARTSGDPRPRSAGRAVPAFSLPAVPVPTGRGVPALGALGYAIRRQFASNVR